MCGYYLANTQEESVSVLIKQSNKNQHKYIIMTPSFRIIVTGDSSGNIIFFDKQLKLLFWLSDKISGAIRHISFQLSHEDMNTNKLINNYSSEVADDEKIVSATNYFDYSDKYEAQIGQKNNIPENCSLISQDFFISKSFLFIILILAKL